jgi:transposase InsO family protein
MKVVYIDQYKELFGVQPICDVLSETDAPIAPSTYYAARSRPPSARSRRDEELTEGRRRIHADNYGVYGARKVHAALLREDFTVARCMVERLMRQAGLRGVIRAKSLRTTRPAPETDRPAPRGGPLTTPQASLDATDRCFAPPCRAFDTGLRRRAFPPTPPVCYRASWQLPGPDFHRQATTSLRLKIYNVTKAAESAGRAKAQR